MSRKRRISTPALQLGLLAAVAITGVVCVPVGASASSNSTRTSAPRAAAATGVVYGGRTAEGWPVVVEVTKSQRRIKQAVIGISLRCSSGSLAFYWDQWNNLGVNKKRKFGASGGPVTDRYEDGTSADFESRISGTFNRARSKLTGTWRLRTTYHDASGTVIDACDSGTVRWTAKQ
jgi:hypothetical protein